MGALGRLWLTRPDLLRYTSYMAKIRKMLAAGVAALAFSGAGVQVVNADPGGVSGWGPFTHEILSEYSLHGNVSAVETSPSPSAPLRVAGSGVRVYDFITLYAELGYPDPSYFGASSDEVRSLETYTEK